MVEIVHFVHALNGRAVADITCCLAEEMQMAGRATIVIASAVTPGARSADGVEVVDLGGDGRRTLPTVRRLAGALREISPRMIFAHAEGPTRSAFAATRTMRPRPKLIGISHNHYSSYPWKLPRLRGVMDGLMMPRLDALIGVSPGVADDLRTTFPATAGRVHMVPEPLTRWRALPQLAAEPIDHPWFDGAAPVVVTVGHVHPRKDHETLVRAIAELRDRGAVIPRVVVIGSTGHPHVDRVRALMAELGVDRDVALLGEVANPLPYVAAADLFVLTSRNEGLPVSLLEAMGVGTPIVSTDAPSGPRYALADGEGGMLTPVGDPPALATAIDRMLGDPSLRERFTAAGRDRAGEFSPLNVAQEYLGVADALP